MIPIYIKVYRATIHIIVYGQDFKRKAELGDVPDTVKEYQAGN
jgi:hypothetical protein